MIEHILHKKFQEYCNKHKIGDAYLHLHEPGFAAKKDKTVLFEFKTYDELLNELSK